MSKLSGVRFINRLPQDVHNVRVRFAAGEKGTSVWSYAFNWSEVNVETKQNVLHVVDVDIGHVNTDESKIVYKEIPFNDNYRGYWQVYFKNDGSNYKINKNNAQANPWNTDDNELVEITLRKEGLHVRVELTFTSGHAYFYCQMC